MVHLNSNQVNGGEPKRVDKDLIMFGELALNYAKGYEEIQFKNSDGEIVAIPYDFFYYRNGVNELTSANSITVTKQHNTLTINSDTTLVFNPTGGLKQLEKYGTTEFLIDGNDGNKLTLSAPNGYTFVNATGDHVLMNGEKALLTMKCFGKNVFTEFKSIAPQNIIRWSGGDFLRLRVNGKLQDFYSSPIILDESLTSMAAMFTEVDNEKLVLLDVSHLDTKDVTSMEGAFAKTTQALELGNMNTSNVKNMRSMFEACSSITALNVSDFDTSNVEDMAYMFKMCFSLTSLDLSGWDVSNVTNVNEMFTNCKSLKNLNLSGWNLKGIPDLRDSGDATMFSGCSDEIVVDVTDCNQRTINLIYDNLKLAIPIYEYSDWKVVTENGRKVIKNIKDEWLIVTPTEPSEPEQYETQQPEEPEQEEPQQPAEPEHP